MWRIMKAGLVASAAVAVVACGSTTFQSTWSDPNAGQLRIEDGTKIVTFFATDNTAKRRGLETALANELNEHGVEGVPAHSILPADVGHDASKGKSHIEKSGAAYALVMQITGSEQQISSTPSMHGGFYGPGWGGWGWGWGGGGGMDIRTDTLVGVQTQLFDLKADKLVWAGQSNTMNPSKAESFARELIRAVGNEMQKAGLVGPPKKG